MPGEMGGQGEAVQQGKISRQHPAERRASEARFRRAILRWFRQHSRSFPWRESQDPYSVLVGEVLLQRTRGEHVTGIYARFLERWPNADALARAQVRSIAAVIRPLGLAKRASILKRLGRALVERGEVPLEPQDLLELPGVGPYAAHSVPVFVGGQSLPLVDWVIARVLRRYFGLPADRRPNADRKLWELATSLARAGRARDLWLGTLDFGASICRPRPRCPICPLRLSCSYAVENFFAQM